MTLTEWIEALVLEISYNLSRAARRRLPARERRSDARPSTHEPRPCEADTLERRLLLSLTPVQYQTQSMLTFGIRPMAVAAADVNGDTKPDLIVVNSGNNNIGVALGNGDGTFQSPQTFATGQRPDNIAVGELIQGGNLDVVVTNSNDGTISVLMGNGNGTFAAQATYAVGSNPVSVALADFNHDQNLDIVVVNSGSANVGVLLNNGNGTFAPEQIYGTGLLPNSVAVADVNADTNPDLIVADNAVGTNIISVLLGNGDGSFKPQETFTAGQRPMAVAAANLNGDGKPDLIVADNPVSGAAGITVLLNDGNGNFPTQQTYAAGKNPMFVTAADLNGDGMPDVIVVDSGLNSADVLLGDGDGMLQPAVTFPIGGLAYDVTVAQVNGDGTPDLITANYGTNNVSVLLGLSSQKSNATIVVNGVVVGADGSPHAAAGAATGTQGEDLSSLLHLSYQNIFGGPITPTPPTQVGTYEIFASFDGNATYNSLAMFDTGKTLVIDNQSALHPVLLGRLPGGSLVSGQKIRPIRETVRIINAAATAFTGSATVNLVLSTDPQGAAGSPIVGTIVKSVKLKATRIGAFGVITIKTLPANLVGSYHLVAELTDNLGNANTVATPGTITIAAPVGDLAGVSVRALGKGKIGKPLHVIVTALQGGNIPFTGSLPVELFLSTTTTPIAGSIDLGLVSGHASIPAGKRGTLRLTATIPSTVTAGPYFVVASIDPNNTLSDINLANNVVASGKMITVD